MKSIVAYEPDQTAAESADRYVTLNGRRYARKTTRDWKLCVEWKYGSTSWEHLSDLKESYPVGVAEYALAQGIDHAPAFA